MSGTGDADAARIAGYEEVRRRAAEARAAAQGAIDERDLVEHEVDAGDYEAGSDDHLERLEVVAMLEEAAAAATDAVDDALDLLRALEIEAMAGQSAHELTAAARSAERQRRAATDPDERLAWQAIGEAADLLLAGVDPDWARAGAPLGEVGPGEGAGGSGPGSEDLVPPGLHAPMSAPAATEAPHRTAIASPARAGRRRRHVPARPTATELISAVVVVAVVVAGLAIIGAGGGGTPVRVETGSAPASAPPAPPAVAHPTTVITVPSATAPPTLAPTTPPSPTVPPTTAVAVDITTQAEACPSLRSGSVGPFTPNSTSTGVGTDPRHNVTTPYVGIGFTGPVGAAMSQRPAYTVVAILDRPGVPAAASGGAIDREGSVQLWFTWDGVATHHKGVRRLVGGSWTMSLDPDELTVAFGPSSTVFFWPGVQAGWTFAMYVATASGCVSAASGPRGSSAPVKTS